ncbi:MAG: SDR family NAD(P)-dependent oxidoreductase [Deltaproteobacteria bacterium]|nr:SDR family NAD(P)-dependent oxidoreductase [Deltaproteobacteria bacterium]
MYREISSQFLDIGDHLVDKRVLVTGGAGAIGSNLVKALTALGSQVVVVDDLSSGYLQNLHGVEDRIEFVQGDISQGNVLAQLFEYRFDLIFHLAAFFANQNSVEHPEEDLTTNGMGTLKVCRMAARTRAGRLVFISSSCVYGSAEGAISEEMPRDPHTPYAMTKILGEHYVDFYRQHHSLDTVILRYFNSFGPGEYPGRYRNVIPNFFEAAMAGEPLPLTGTGEETRDFTFVEDTVRGTLLAGVVPSAVGQTLNIGTGRETPIADLALAINEIVGNTAGVVYRRRRNWDRISRRCACIERAEGLIGYRPLVSLEEGLRATYRWFLELARGPARLAVEQRASGV